VNQPPAVVSKQPVIIGHRGMGRSHKAPGNPFVENTRASYLAAYDAGATWVEMDLLTSADGDLFTHHDHFVNRKPIWTRSTSDLLGKGLELFDGICEDMPSGLGFDIEVKAVPGDVSALCGPPLLSKVIEWAHQHKTCRDVVVTSFDPYVAQVANHAGLRAGWITRGKFPLFELVTAAGLAGLDLVVVHGNTLEKRAAYEYRVGMQIARDLGIEIWSYDSTVARIPEYAGDVAGFCVDDVRAAALLVGQTPNRNH
jgi:glycerophosphoryl diester phosphodiesterase